MGSGSAQIVATCLPRSCLCIRKGLRAATLRGNLEHKKTSIQTRPVQGPRGNLRLLKEYQEVSHGAVGSRSYAQMTLTVQERRSGKHETLALPRSCLEKNIIHFPRAQYTWIIICHLAYRYLYRLWFHLSFWEPGEFVAFCAFEHVKGVDLFTIRARLAALTTQINKHAAPQFPALP